MMKREKNSDLKDFSVSWTMLRYIFKEATFSFLVSFAFFFFIFFVNQLLLMAQDILTQKVPFRQVALLVLFSLPSIVAMSSPFASLLGTLMTVGRMSSDNEMLIMSSSGLSYRNLFVPTIILGILVSLVSFGVNDVLLPAGTIQFTRLYRRIMVSTPALEMSSNSVKTFKNTTVVTGSVTGNTIADMLIIDRTSEGERRVITAKTAEFSDLGRDGISLDLSNAFIQAAKESSLRDYDYASSDFLRYRIQATDMMGDINAIGPREMGSVDVRKEIIVKESNVARTVSERNRRTVDTALNLESALREGQSGRRWNQRENLLAAYLREYQMVEAAKKDRSLLIYRLEYYKKFSIPFGGLALVFIAVPLGLFAKKSGQTVGFVFGIFIAVFYWALLLVGQNLGIRLGYSPFITMWLPNILAIGSGLAMSLVRIRR
jgi:lipopolysaccharide export system permease protein